MNGFSLIRCDMAHFFKAFDAGFYVVQLLVDELFHGFSAGTTFAGAFCLHRAVDFVVLDQDKQRGQTLCESC